MGSYIFAGSMASLANLEYAAHGMDKETKVSGHKKRKRNKINKPKRKKKETT